MYVLLPVLRIQKQQGTKIPQKPKTKKYNTIKTMNIGSHRFNGITQILARSLFGVTLHFFIVVVIFSGNTRTSMSPQDEPHPNALALFDRIEKLCLPAANLVI